MHADSIESGLAHNVIFMSFFFFFFFRKHAAP